MMQFAPGVRIHHKSMGPGEIVDVVVRGATRLLTVRFDGKDQDTSNLPFNLHRMRILEESG